MNRYYYEYRSLGKLRFVSMFVTIIIMPGIFIYLYAQYGKGEIFGSAALHLSNLIYPMFSSLNGLLLLRNYVESRGNELFFVYQKEKLSSILNMLILYLVPVLITFIFLGFAWKPLWLDFCGVFVSCLFLNAFTYLFLMYIPVSVIALFINIIYPIYVIYYYNGGYQWYIYYYREDWHPAVMLRVLVPMLAASLCMYIFAYEKNMNYKNYKI